MLTKAASFRIAGMVFLLSALFLSAYADQEWINIQGGTGSDEGLAIANGDSGNTYVAGYKWNGSFYGSDFLVLKYNMCGKLVWQKLITKSGNDTAKAVVVTSNFLENGVYVTGTGSYGSDTRFLTVKLNKYTGEFMDSISFGETGYNYCAMGIAAYSNQIYVVGYGQRDELGLLKEDVVTVKYNSSLGSPQWVYEDYSPVTPTDDRGMALCVDNTGIYITGQIWRASTVSRDLFVIKYNTSLVRQWDYFHDGNYIGEVGSGDCGWEIIAPSGESNVYVVGECDEGLLGSNYQCVTIAVGKSDSSETWLQHFGTDAYHDKGEGIAYYNNWVYVTAHYGTGDGADYGTTRYNADNGNPGGAKFYDYADGWDVPKDIAVNYIGVYLTGKSYGGVSTADDIATLAYNHELTETLWEERYDGPATGSASYDEGRALVALNYNAYITGGSTGQSTGLDAATIRYNGGPCVQFVVEPDTIPPGGIIVNIPITVSNHYIEPISVDFKIVAYLPTGSTIVLNSRSNIILQPDTVFVRNLPVPVPAGAPPGTYLIKAFLGEFNIPPITFYDMHCDSFVKQGVTVGENLDPWTASLEALELEKGQNELPLDYKLEQNYPNPFNPSTVIRYQMPDARHVNIQVYDIAGKLVTTLVDGWREAGVHETTFDGTGLPSGVYLLRLEAGPYTATQKLMLLK